MSTSAKASFPFDDFTNRVAFALHRPNHGKPLLVRRNVFGGDHPPVILSDMITEFLMHSNMELILIGLSEGISKGHCVGVSDDVCKYMFTH